MSYTRNIVMNLGAANVGLDTRMQITDTAGADVGAELSDIIVRGNGSYSLDVSFPNGHRGAIKIYEDGSPAIPLATLSINPQGSENDDVKTSKAELASNGLDNISITEPTGPATTFPQMVVQLWMRFFRLVTLTTSILKVFKSDSATVSTTQAVSDDGTTQRVDKAT